jgi:hypothetical protein
MNFYAHGEGVGLLIVDMNGNIVKQWPISVLREPKLLENGNALVAQVTVDERRSPPIRQTRIREFDWDGQAVWEVEPPPEALRAEAHAEMCGGILAVRLENGNTICVHKEPVPWRYMQRIADPARRNRADYNGDCLREITPDGHVVWEWKTYEHIDMNLYLGIDPSANWTHFNSVQALPENKWHDGGDVRFRPGNLLLSPRTLGFVFIVDKETGEIVWRTDGRIQLSGQHAPRMIEKGFPGAGNILVFDNGVPPLLYVYQVGKSRVVEVNPVTYETVWAYENGYDFFAPFTGNAERLPNGNTLICESFASRVFEVTADGEIVWECVFGPDRWGLGTAYRYTYDYCPQLAGLGRPREERVAPPPHVRTRPRIMPRGDPGSDDGSAGLN